MKFVKAKIVGKCSCSGKEMWVDVDSKLTHLFNGKLVKTYKVYDYNGECKNAKQVKPSHYWTRFNVENVEFIEEDEQVPSPMTGGSMFDDVVKRFGDQKLFSVVDDHGNPMTEGVDTFKKCKDYISKYKYEELYIVMVIMKQEITQTPTI